ncbi:hypothetical protein SCHPADRAFT_941446 [Schizopora paradoxa]|uniref:RTA1-domain-containing protein n=1 Tax=Schizopora paradoxa TaxID=27342 RepID=A0A0H2RRU2_9AGAM|nr:hypothetical protein SCHPADRAFT_941446 [Schizopora paradoxa]
MSSAQPLLHIPLGSPVLELWFNGFYTCLTIVTLYAIAKKPHSEVRSKKTWMGIVLLMYMFATIHAVVAIVFEIRTLQIHGGNPDVAAAYTRMSPALRGLGAMMFVMSILVADFLFIWRCWLVWERRWLVTVIPILSTIAGLVCALISVVGQVEESAERVPGVVPKHFVTFSTPYFALSLVTSLYSTVFIAIRVLWVQLEMRRLGVESQYQGSYARMIEIIFESAVIYSVNMIAFVALTQEKTVKLDWPQNIHPQIAGITPTLIILRVALGYSRPDADWSTPYFRSLGNIVFAHSNDKHQGSTTLAGDLESGSKEKVSDKGSEHQEESVPTL